MKLWSSEHIFKHPWKQTTEAVWKKYPNEQMPNVAFIDVIDRKVTEDGKLRTTRLFGSEFSFPRLITTLLGMPDMCYAIEYSEVDLKNQKMTLRMINYTFGSVLTVREKLIYQPLMENPNETQLMQGAKITLNGIQFASYFEDMLVNRFEATSKKGRSAIENVLRKITVENILKTVKEELEELSSDVDRAATKFDSEFNISERVQELSQDLDRATTMINTEIQTFSKNLHSEFVQLVNSLNSELSQVVIKVNTSERKSNLDLSGGLTAAVNRAGITAKTES